MKFSRRVRLYHADYQKVGNIVLDKKGEIEHDPEKELIKVRYYKGRSHKVTEGFWPMDRVEIMVRL